MKFLNRIHMTMKTRSTCPVPSIVRADTATWRALLVLCCALVLTMALPRAHAAGPPEAMTFQGFLVDANGNPLATNNPANYPVFFRIFAAPTGGASLWSEQQIVTVDKGNFSVILSEGTAVGGEPKPLLSTVLATNGADRYIQLSVTIGPSTSDMLPRLRLLPSPYAFLASSANQLVNPSGTPVVTYANSRVEINGPFFASGTITGNGSGLTTLNAANLSSGAIPDARLSANVALRSGGNAFSGNQTFAGNMGIGTLGVGFPLTLSSTLGDKLSLFGDSGSHYGFGVQSSLLQIHADIVGSDIAFGYGSSAAFTELMRIKGNGRVGIGTNNPTSKLTVNGGVRADGGAPGVGGANDNGYSFSGGGGDADSGMFSSADGQVEFYANGVERMRVFGANVGIGTTNPTATLDVNGSIKSTSLTVNGLFTATTFSATTINATTVNGEQPPITFTVPTVLPGNLASYRQVQVDCSALLGDADGGRVKFILRDHSVSQVRTYSTEFICEQDTDFSKPTTGGRRTWSVNSYGQEYAVNIGTTLQTDVFAAPWNWCFVRNYSSNEATGTGNGAATSYADRFKFWFLVGPNVTATIIVYDR